MQSNYFRKIQHFTKTNNKKAAYPAHVKNAWQDMLFCLYKEFYLISR